MQDAITAVINSYDVQGKYLDSSAMEKLKAFFATGELRVRAAATIAANASTIVKDAAAKALLYSDLTRPGGNMYTTRRYAACIRDMDYYLRYATYAMLAGDPSILDERVLNGLKETHRAEEPTDDGLGWSWSYPRSTTSTLAVSWPKLGTKASSGLYPHQSQLDVGRATLGEQIPLLFNPGRSTEKRHRRPSWAP